MSIHILNKRFSEKEKIYNILRSFYGLGHSRSQYLLELSGLNVYTCGRDLNLYKIELLSFFLKTVFSFDKFLRKQIKFNLYKISITGNYKSYRFRLGLPSNGQRTHTNAQTSKRYKSRYLILNLN